MVGQRQLTLFTNAIFVFYACMMDLRGHSSTSNVESDRFPHPFHPGPSGAAGDDLHAVPLRPACHRHLAPPAASCLRGGGAGPRPRRSLPGAGAGGAARRADRTWRAAAARPTRLAGMAGAWPRGAGGSAARPSAASGGTDPAAFGRRPGRPAVTRPAERAFLARRPQLYSAAGGGLPDARLGPRRGDRLHRPAPCPRQPAGGAAGPARSAPRRACQPARPVSSGGASAGPPPPGDRRGRCSMPTRPSPPAS